MASTQTAPEKSGFSLKPSLDWLLVFVPISIFLRFGPVNNQTALRLRCHHSSGRLDGKGNGAFGRKSRRRHWRLA
jgi:hypothetical protein